MNLQVPNKSEDIIYAQTLRRPGRSTQEDESNSEKIKSEERECPLRF
jgi:hypothetical protein